MKRPKGRDYAGCTVEVSSYFISALLILLPVSFVSFVEHFPFCFITGSDIHLWDFDLSAFLVVDWHRRRLAAMACI